MPVCVSREALKKLRLRSRKDLWMAPKRTVPKSDRRGRNSQLETEVGRLETPGSELKSRGEPRALGARGSNAGMNPDAAPRLAQAACTSNGQPRGPLPDSVVDPGKPLSTQSPELPQGPPLSCS